MTNHDHLSGCLCRLRNAALPTILALGAVVLLTANASQAVAQATAEPAASQPATNQPATGQPATEQKAANEPAEASLIVPESKDPEVLMQFIERVATMPAPQTENQELLVAHFVQRATALSQAADRLLAVTTDEETTLQAISIKLQSLSLLDRVGIESAGQELEALVAKYAEDPRPQIARPMKQQQYALQVSAIQTQAADPNVDLAVLAAQARELATKFRKSLTADAEPEPTDLQLASSLVSLLNMTDQGPQAAEAAQEFAEYFGRSKDPRLAAYAAKFAGMARQSALLGNSMEIKGTLVDGTKFDWAKYQGKVVLVDFWATWCGPCMAELPNVRRQYALYHERGFEIVGISLDDDKESLTTFLDKAQIPWATLFSEEEDTSGWNHPMATYYGVTGIPMAILINREGKVVSLHAQGEQLQKLLAELLGPPDVKTTEPK